MAYQYAFSDVTGAGPIYTLAPGDSLFVGEGADIGATSGNAVVATGNTYIEVRGSLYGLHGIYHTDNTGTSYLTISKTGAVIGTGGTEAVDLYNNYDVTNYGEITCLGGAGYGLLTSSGDGTFHNYGSVTASAYAIVGGLGDDLIYNQGTMVGKIDLGFGSDFYNGVGGTLTGTLDGGSGSDTVSFAGNERAVVVDLSVNLTWDGLKNQTTFNFENAVGTSFNDKFYGNGADNTFDGGSGGSDLFYGGTGSDTVSFASSLHSVIVDLGGNLTWNGTVNSYLDSIENVTGSNGNDLLYGSGGRNTMDGGPSGADTMYGGDDIDTLSYASSERSVIIDLPSNLTWDGLVNDQVFGFENVIGSNAGDRVTGTNGANVITGGLGSDTLTGGQGTDTFVYNARNEGGDTITDFTSGSDHLQFSTAAFSSSAAFVASTAPTASTGNPTFLYNTNTGVLNYDPDGTGSASAVNIAVLTGHPTLGLSDFLFV